MKKSFGNEQTERLFHRLQVKKLASAIQRAALRKLVLLDAAKAMEDLRVPPGNRLEKLVGDRAGQYSIRVNDQWRIGFQWSDGDAYEVEVTDFH